MCVIFILQETDDSFNSPLYDESFTSSFYNDFFTSQFYVDSSTFKNWSHKPHSHSFWFDIPIRYVSFLGSTSRDHAMYIVHMDLSIMSQAFASYHGWFVATLDSIAPVTGLVYVYNNALHGFITRLSPLQLEWLKKSHGFMSCHAIYSWRRIQLTPLNS